GLGFCAQEVLAAAETMKEASVGTAPASTPKGFDATEIAGFLRRSALQLKQAELPSRAGISPRAVADEAAGALENLVAGVEANSSLRLEDLERRLTVLEEKLFAVLLATVPDDEIVEIREQADRELAAYRSKMPATQVEQLRKQFVHKRLLEKYGVP